MKIKNRNYIRIKILLALTYCHHQSSLREKAKILNVPKSIIYFADKKMPWRKKMTSDQEVRGGQWLRIGRR